MQSCISIACTSNKSVFLKRIAVVFLFCSRTTKTNDFVVTPSVNSRIFCEAVFWVRIANQTDQEDFHFNFISNLDFFSFTTVILF